MDIENIKYSSFFSNLKEEDLPLVGTEERDQLRKRERSRCLGGVYVDGVFIPGWLYWHINFWWISDDIQDEYGNIIPYEGVSTLRDNEWVRAESIELCKNHPDGMKGYVEVGARQLGKTTLETSFSSYNAIMFKGSQNIVVSGSDDDMGNIKLRLNYGLSKLHPIIGVPKLTKDKRAKYITLGYKDGNGDEQIWSYIITRNLAEGKNTEGPAGVTAKSAIFDEIGKAPFSQALEALKPALMSKFGWRAVPILVGTGGAFEKGEDAERIFYHPEANNFLGFKHPSTGEVTGLFMPGTFRTDCKYRTNLAEYLISKGKLKQGTYPELSKIPIDVSDEVKALKKIKAEREAKANDPDKTEYLKLKMYFPLEPKECFMKGSDNMFNTAIINQQKDKLLLDFPGLKIGMYIELDETIVNGEKIITHRTSSKLPITSYPCKQNENRDAPIVILEHPIKDPPYGLYVAGADPYRHVVITSNSESNGSIYIFKRSYDVLSDKFQDMPIAWYTARPDDKGTWNDNARKLIKYYNAQCLCENDEYGFIEYMISKGEGHMMLDTPGWLREVAANSATLLRPKGMSSANRQIREMTLGTFKQYLEEPFTTLQAYSKEGIESIPVPGAAKIYDPILLEEIIKWNTDGNFDRIVACFRKGSIISTIEGYKSIENVQVNDLVLTHTGSYNKVKTLFKTHVTDEELIKLDVMGFEDEIACTKEHPFFISNVKKGKGRSYLKNVLIGNLNWIEANDLKIADHFLIPRRKDLLPTKIPKKLLYILGWYLSDGHRSRNNIRICFQGDQLDLANQVKTYIEEFDDFDKKAYKIYNWKYKREIDVVCKRKKPRIYKIKDKFAFNLEFNSGIFNRIIDEYIEIKKGGEKVINSKLFNCNNLLPLILGFIEGDGHQKETISKGSINSRHTIEVSGSYLNLIRQIRQILFDNDIWCTSNWGSNENPILRLDIQDQNGINRIINSMRNPCNKFNLTPARKQRKNHIIISEGILVPIKKIERELVEREIVYNFEVENDNSYVVSMLAVHNCSFAITCARKMDATGLQVSIGDGEPEKRTVYRQNKLLRPIVNTDYNRSPKDQLKKLFK